MLYINFAGIDVSQPREVKVHLTKDGEIPDSGPVVGTLTYGRTTMKWELGVWSIHGTSRSG